MPCASPSLGACLQANTPGHLHTASVPGAVVRDRAWRRRHVPLGAADIQRLRVATEEMFDHGYTNYLEHAFPKVGLSFSIACPPG